MENYSKAIHADAMWRNNCQRVSTQAYLALTKGLEVAELRIRHDTDLRQTKHLRVGTSSNATCV